MGVHDRSVFGHCHSRNQHIRLVRYVELVHLSRIFSDTKSVSVVFDQVEYDSDSETLPVLRKWFVSFFHQHNYYQKSISLDTRAFLAEVVSWTRVRFGLMEALNFSFQSSYMICYGKNKEFPWKPEGRITIFWQTKEISLNFLSQQFNRFSVHYIPHVDMICVSDFCFIVPYHPRVDTIRSHL